MSFKGSDGNRNGRQMDIQINNDLIGMPDQNFTPYVEFSEGDKMRRSGTKDQTQVFDNNGGFSKADGAGTINKNGEYGPVTYGF